MRVYQVYLTAPDECTQFEKRQIVHSVIAGLPYKNNIITIRLEFLCYGTLLLQEPNNDIESRPVQVLAKCGDYAFGTTDEEG